MLPRHCASPPSSTCLQTLKANPALSARARSHHGPTRRCPQTPIGNSSCLITLWCRWTISRISMTTRSFPLTTISPRMAVAQQSQIQQAQPQGPPQQQPSQQREPASPMPARRMLAPDAHRTPNEADGTKAPSRQQPRQSARRATGRSSALAVPKVTPIGCRNAGIGFESAASRIGEAAAKPRDG